MPNIFEQILEERKQKNPASASTVVSRPKNIFEEILEEKKQKPGLLSQIGQNAKEAFTQGGKGIASGVLGSYGDLLDLLGLQSKNTLPGEEAKRSREFEALSRWQKGERPTFTELQEMSDDDIAPRYSRLPTSQQVESGIEKIGGPGKPETVTGRFAERAGKFVGAGSAFGVPAVKASGAAAVAGQTAEELGAPGWLQATVEIGSFLKNIKAKDVPITAKDKRLAVELRRLKKHGFTDDDLTLAKNALEDRGWLKKTSKITKEAESRFQNTYQSTQDNFHKIVDQSLPGLSTGGAEQFKKASGELFGALEDLSKDVVIKNPEYFTGKIDDTIKSLKRSLANTPQEKQVIELLSDAKEAALQKGITGDFYTSFYQGLNSIGNWKNSKQKEHVFTTIKDAIKETFRQQGPEGQQLAKSLEEANKSYIKYLRAEDVSELIKKSVTEEGMNFRKMYKLLDNPSNMDVLVKGLGSKDAQSLRNIAKTGMNIKDLHKMIEGGMAKEALGAGKMFALVKAASTYNFGALKAYVGAEALSRLSTKMLTDPSYQNLQLKMLQAIKSEKWTAVRSLAYQLDKKIENEEP